MIIKLYTIISNKLWDLSLYFRDLYNRWSFLLFLVCHETAFLFSTRAMTALGWLPKAHGHFLFRVFNSRHDVHSGGWRRYVTRIPSIFSSKIIISRWAFWSQRSAVIAHVLNKNAVSWQTRNNRKLPKHKLSQNAKNLQCLLKFGLIEDNVTVFQWPWNSESR